MPSVVKELSLQEIDLSPLCMDLCEFNAEFELAELEDLYYSILDDLENQFMEASLPQVEQEQENIADGDYDPEVDYEDEEYEDHDEEDNDLSFTAIEKVNDIRQTRFESICNEYRHVLGRTGLSLELSRPSGWKPAEGETFHDTRSMGIFDELQTFFKIVNGKGFVSYLEALSDHEITDEQAESLEAITSDILRQLKEDYRLSDANDGRSIELLGYLGKIIENHPLVNDLNSSHIMGELEKYYLISQQGFLREFLGAERLKLTSIDFVGGHGEIDYSINHIKPARWHMDLYLTADEYRSRWNKALEFLVGLPENPNAAAFKSDLITALKQGLAQAIISPEETEHGVRVKTEASEFLSVMISVQKELYAL